MKAPYNRIWMNLPKVSDSNVSRSKFYPTIVQRTMFNWWKSPYFFAISIDDTELENVIAFWFIFDIFIQHKFLIWSIFDSIWFILNLFYKKIKSFLLNCLEMNMNLSFSINLRWILNWFVVQIHQQVHRHPFSPEQNKTNLFIPEQIFT